MLWAQSINDYLTLTDDVAFVRQIYPQLKKFLAHLEQQTNTTSGLLDLPPGHWSQNALIDWVGYRSRYGQSTALNALYYKTLLDSAAIAERLGDVDNATNWRQQAQQLRQHINLYLYHSTQSEYVSSIVAGKALTPTTHAQAWPLALGVTAEENRAAVANKMVENFHLEIFGMFWGLEALGSTNKIDSAIQFIDQQYGHLLALGATTWWEHWNSVTNYKAALSHGWGASPTWFLTTYLLGARRIGPQQWSVQPAFTGVEWASGHLPLQKGELAVEWHHKRCAETELVLDAPFTSQGNVVLPLTQLATVWYNDQLLWPEKSKRMPIAETVENHLQIRLWGGHHAFRLQFTCTDH
jgi:alpha-L-rhamnosidase